MKLPFRYEQIATDAFLITNDVGDYVILHESEIAELIKPEIEDENLKKKLMSKWLYCDDYNLPQVTEILATRYRTKKSFLFDFTALHMVIPTLYCNSHCIYCQVSSIEYGDKHKYMMDFKTAKKAVDLIFDSPSQYLKIEFQGGEPTLNFDIVRFIIRYAELKNAVKKRNLEFVICTNLLHVTRDQLEYLHKHNVHLSTSLDGPQDLHDFNRKMYGGESAYKRFIENLAMAREIYSDTTISALMTTTKESLKYGKRIVDSYIDNGFCSIFLRELNPFGVAEQNKELIGYNIHDFIKFYKDIIDYIIDLNLKGTFFVEDYTNLLLERIFTPFSTGFVDLQSPSGIGIGCAVYNYNGKVYVSDEGRMVGETGDDTFAIGSCLENNYSEIFTNPNLENMIAEGGILDNMAGCSNCAFLPYCGTDPVRNHVSTGSFRYGSYNTGTCLKNKYIFNMIFNYIHEGNTDVIKVFESWVYRKGRY